MEAEAAAGVQPSPAEEPLLGIGAWPLAVAGLVRRSPSATRSASSHPSARQTRLAPRLGGCQRADASGLAYARAMRGLPFGL